MRDAGYGTRGWSTPDSRIPRPALRQSPIHVAAVADANNEHQQSIVLDLVDDPVVTDSDPVRGVKTLNGHSIRWTRRDRERINTIANATLHLGG
jgi:hypothetical protein